ncbi:unnamed protein product [Larinioides sclopetarius]|uniref:Uncharacterized protein n=1 Tax=Larinioides sclopetarius TaxID=280406 RepID=A0AAV1ZNU1_9ARAC
MIPEDNLGYCINLLAFLVLTGLCILVFNLAYPYIFDINVSFETRKHFFFGAFTTFLGLVIAYLICKYIYLWSHE